MTRRNGGIIGVDNLPNSTTASGMWRLQEAQKAIEEGDWPLVRTTVEYLVIAGGGGGGNLLVEGVVQVGSH
jgi:hypothetical protein